MEESISFSYFKGFCPYQCIITELTAKKTAMNWQLQFAGIGQYWPVCDWFCIPILASALLSHTCDLSQGKQETGEGNSLSKWSWIMEHPLVFDKLLYNAFHTGLNYLNFRLPCPVCGPVWSSRLDLHQHDQRGLKDKCMSDCLNRQHVACLWAESLIMCYV